MKDANNVALFHRTPPCPSGVTSFAETAISGPLAAKAGVDIRAARVIELR
jgi:hypothetical protein